MKPTYKAGAEARKNFEEGMSKLFRAPKPPKEPKLKPQKPPKE